MPPVDLAVRSARRAGHAAAAMCGAWAVGGLGVPGACNIYAGLACGVGSHLVDV